MLLPNNVKEIPLESINTCSSSPSRISVYGGAYRIEIESHSSELAFREFKKRTCDIVMESLAMAPLQQDIAEHVIGLDDLAIIVNKKRSIAQLTKDQLQGIFSGDIYDWNQLGPQQAGPIDVYIPFADSDDAKTFKSLTGIADFSTTKKYFENSTELSRAIAGNLNAIGFVGLPFIGNNKPLGISEDAGEPKWPVQGTVGATQYPLCRRLSLYAKSESGPHDGVAREFLEFALSKTGQDIVFGQGFARQFEEPNLPAETTHEEAPGDYDGLIAGAQRIEFRFRFRSGSIALDTTAADKLKEIAVQLRRFEYLGNSILLLGFADKSGYEANNAALSRNRARIVHDELSTYGVRQTEVIGFGSDHETAPNDTPQGREQNRRVEIWVRQQ